MTASDAVWLLVLVVVGAGFALMMRRIAVSCQAGPTVVVPPEEPDAYGS